MCIRDSYLKAGIPMFVDKPITIEEEEAVSLARIAKYKGIPLCGGSCCGGVTAAQSLKKLVAHPTERLGIVTGGTVVLSLIHILGRMYMRGAMKNLPFSADGRLGWFISSTTSFPL